MRPGMRFTSAVMCIPLQARWVQMGRTVRLLPLVPKERDKGPQEGEGPGPAQGGAAGAAAAAPCHRDDRASENRGIGSVGKRRAGYPSRAGASPRPHLKRLTRIAQDIVWHSLKNFSLVACRRVRDSR